jgi:hypothetical protein
MESEQAQIHLPPEKPQHSTSIDPAVRYENEYSTCCSRSGKTDARLIRYVSRFSLSIITLVFAGVQLVRAHDCDPLVPFWTSLITFVLGAWIKIDGQKAVSQNN